MHSLKKMKIKKRKGKNQKKKSSQINKKFVLPCIRRRLAAADLDIFPQHIQNKTLNLDSFVYVRLGKTKFEKKKKIQNKKKKTWVRIKRKNHAKSTKSFGLPCNMFVVYLADIYHSNIHHIH